MNFDLSEDQRMLAKTVASFASKSSPLKRARSLRDDAVGWEKSVWAHMGELGWLAVPFSEEHGGLGGSFVDAALVLEHLASTLVPEPYVATVVLAGSALAQAGSDAQRERFLAPALEGKASLALAYAESRSRYDVGAIETRATRSGDGFELRGEKTFVLDGHAANHVVVSALVEGTLELFVVDREAKGVVATPIKLIDGRRGARLRFEGAMVEADRRLSGAPGLATLERAVDRGAAAAVAEGLGIASAMLAMTLDYLRTREQFEVKIGSFQALQHTAVDMFVELELLRSMSMLASVKADDEDASARRTAISAAKAKLDSAGKLISQRAIQLHGGIGITDEHDIGLYFKRMEALRVLFGDDEYHVARYGREPQFAA